jgi:hypothetical protein
MQEGIEFWGMLAGLAAVAGWVIHRMIRHGHWSDLLVVLLLGGAFIAAAAMIIIRQWY